MGMDGPAHKLRKSGRRVWRRLAGGYPIVRLIVLIGLIWTLGTLLLWRAEGPQNPEFGSFANTLWNITVYLFSGLDSGQPGTAAGRVIAIGVLALSAGVVAIMTGAIASFLVERRMGSRWKMPSVKLTDHIVVCNWNDKGIPIIRELHADVVKRKHPVVIVSDNVEASALPEHDDSPQFEDVYFVKGDPANETILKRANVQQAHSVVVLAEPSAGELADAKSILIAMAVDRLRKQVERGPWICVEGVAPQNVEHLDRAGADEIISASEFAMLLLSQSARFQGLGEVYRRLLTNTEETNEVYLVPVPPGFIGKTFADLAAAVLAKRDAPNPAILIGAKTQQGVLVNPRAAALAPFAEGDEAIVIAFERPDPLL